MTVPEGMEVAKKHLEELFPELSKSEIQLEELEVPPFGNRWRFTFSTTLPPKNANTLVQVMSQRRVTKLVEIDPQNGDLIAMKNVAA
jgi:hypothetical protein